MMERPNDERRATWPVLVIAVTALAAGCAAHGPPPRPGVPPARCEAFNFPVYFQSGSSGLTDEARLEIATAARAAVACGPGEVEIVGLADGTGSPQRNLALSQARARAVQTALAAEGIGLSRLHVDALGVAGAGQPGGALEPMRRRADVIVRAGRPPAGGV